MNGDETPLERELIRVVETAGPISLERYMAMSLGHPLHGYYMRRDPLGRAGDFTTAPEISQMFGELIGIWCMHCYELIGRPATFDLVELGPGRGTLMMDLLRAARAMPDFLTSLTLRMIDTSPVLRAAQQETLANLDLRVTWHETLEQIPPGPTLLIANEFFDALPLRQFQRLKQGWAERVIGLRDGKLAMGLLPLSFAPPLWAASAGEGDVVEIRTAAEHWAMSIAERLASNPGAALIIDYGHLRSLPGDTLQAVRQHRPVAILDRPGESDLTSHVDFEALSQALRKGGALPCRPLSQRDFLIEMGLELRASLLARTATQEQKRDLASAADRLAGPAQMGHLFKVLAAVSPGHPCPHPFRPNDR